MCVEHSLLFFTFLHLDTVEGTNNVKCYNPEGTQSLYLQKAADRILDRSTRQYNIGSSHITGETDQGLLTVAHICVSRVSKAHPAHCSMHKQ